MGLGTHLLLTGEQLDLLKAQGQARQWRAQLVRGVGGELALGGDPPGHSLRRAHELGLDQVDLLDPRGSQTRPNLTAAELFGLGRQVDEGRGDAPSNPGGHDRGRCERSTGENQDREDDRADDSDPVPAP